MNLGDKIKGGNIASKLTFLYIGLTKHKSYGIINERG